MINNLTDIINDFLGELKAIGICIVAEIIVECCYDGEPKKVDIGHG